MPFPDGIAFPDEVRYERKALVFVLPPPARGHAKPTLVLRASTMRYAFTLAIWLVS